MLDLGGGRDLMGASNAGSNDSLSTIGSDGESLTKSERVRMHHISKVMSQMASKQVGLFTYYYVSLCPEHVYNRTFFNMHKF